MKRIVFGGLNPSKAGWPGGDLTVTKLCGFTARIMIVDYARFEAAGGDVFDVVDGGATFSDDAVYRYRLWRVLARRGVPFARFDIVNLSAWISTDPDALQALDDPFGPDNMRHVDAALLEADLAIAAWGSLASLPAWMRYQGETVLRAFSRSHDVMCLGKTADGSPRHPSRLGYSAQLELFRARRAA